MPKQKPNTELLISNDGKSSRGTKKGPRPADGGENDQEYDDMDLVSVDGRKFDNKLKKDDGEVYIRDDDTEQNF